ncbi:MAG: hypothetical protein P1U58_20795, partial [Verrucomicrobiales bacterium]|nr:hypothetical protein [Verrucomicrobiales bacterium]
AARDDLERQAFEIETMSALMDKELAILRADLIERESEQLRNSLDSLTQRNEELQAQAVEARVKSDLLTQRIEATPMLRAEPIPNQPISAPVANAPAYGGPTGQVSSTQPDRDFSMFYEGLSPHGRWIDVDDFGYSWQPRIAADQGWRPYLDGSWVWTDYGWTWSSNEPFGWATYHYGRWANLSHIGWVWVPDQQWAPAWVSWRQSHDHVGWAPLPPSRGAVREIDRDCDLRYNLGPSSYTFIQTNHFSNRSYRSVCSPAERNSHHFRRSVNTTRIVQRHGYQHQVFAHRGGPACSKIEDAVNGRVPRRKIHFGQSGHVSASPSSHTLSTTAPLNMIKLPLAAAGASIMPPKISELIKGAKRVDALSRLPAEEAATLVEEINGELATVEAIEEAAEVVVATSPPVEPLNVTPASIPETTVEPETPTTEEPFVADINTPEMDAAGTEIPENAPETTGETNTTTEAPIIADSDIQGADSVTTSEELTTPSMQTNPESDTIALPENPDLPMAAQTIENSSDLPPVPEESTTGATVLKGTNPTPTEANTASPDIGNHSTVEPSQNGDVGTTMPTIETPAISNVEPDTIEPASTGLSPTASEMAVEAPTSETNTVMAEAPAAEAVTAEVAATLDSSKVDKETPAAEGTSTNHTAMASEPTDSEVNAALSDEPLASANVTEEQPTTSETEMTPDSEVESSDSGPSETAPAMAGESANAEAENLAAQEAAMAEEQAKAEALAAQQAAMAEEQAKAEALAAQQAAMAEEQAKAETLAAHQAAMAEEQAKAEALAAQQAAMAQEQAKAEALAAQQAAMAEEQA